MHILITIVFKLNYNGFDSDIRDDLSTSRQVDMCILIYKNYDVYQSALIEDFSVYKPSQNAEEDNSHSAVLATKYYIPLGTVASTIQTFSFQTVPTNDTDATYGPSRNT